MTTAATLRDCERLPGGNTLECVIGSIPPSLGIGAVQIGGNINGSPDFIINQAIVRADGIEEVLSNQVVLIILDPGDNGSGDRSLTGTGAEFEPPIYLIIPMRVVAGSLLISRFGFVG